MARQRGLFDIFKKKTEQALKRTKETWFGKITSLFPIARP